MRSGRCAGVGHTGEALTQGSPKNLAGRRADEVGEGARACIGHSGRIDEVVSHLADLQKDLLASISVFAAVEQAFEVSNHGNLCIAGLRCPALRSYHNALGSRASTITCIERFPNFLNN